MSFVADILGRIFPTAENPEADYKPPVHSESLRRSQTFIKDYQRWQNSSRPEMLLSQLRESHENYLLGRLGPVEIKWHNEKASQGFYFTPFSQSRKEDLFFLLDIFRDRTLKMGYALNTADKRLLVRENSVESRERYHLKPQTMASSSIVDQQYGTILIELVSLDDRPEYLKIMTQTHMGHNYSKPLHFDRLVAVLFRLHTPVK